MGAANAFLVGVAKNDPTSASTDELNADDQAKSSAFLTVQSFTNFAAATGAITTAWRAMQALDDQLFNSPGWPFMLCVAWLVVSLVTSWQAGAATEKGATFLVSGIFLGFVNALTLFAAVIGASAAVHPAA